MGLVPKTTKAEVKVFGGFAILRVGGIILSGGVGVMFGALLPYQWLQIVFSVFCVIVFLILSGKSPSNPKRKFAGGLSSMFRFFLSRKKFYGDTSAEYIAMNERKERKAKNNDKTKKRNKRKKEKED